MKDEDVVPVDDYGSRVENCDPSTVVDCLPHQGTQRRQAAVVVNRFWLK